MLVKVMDDYVVPVSTIDRIFVNSPCLIEFDFLIKIKVSTDV